ncbi:MAG: hypothetical protein F4213_06460 [Boseongicola sp. SB0677_bin_26]|nr:hypothetical protein [Boseongicola sp. SB0665_bin_10]MYG25652.1 hypothetical protein [Boseongicola sp. SB0677_bin_26]
MDSLTTLLQNAPAILDLDRLGLSIAPMQWKGVLVALAVVVVLRWLLRRLSSRRIQSRAKSLDEALASSPYIARPALTIGERDLLALIESVLERDLTVMPRLSIRHVLKQDDKGADIGDPDHLLATIVDRSYMPVAVIRHVDQRAEREPMSQSTLDAAIKSNQVRREALVDAGIPIVDIPSTYTEASVRQVMKRASLAMNEGV